MTLSVLKNRIINQKENALADYNPDVVDKLLEKMAAIVDRVAELNRSIPEPVPTYH